MRKIALCVFIFCVLITRNVFANGALMAGIAKIDITPDKPVTLAGYANRTELSKGIHDSLAIRVLAFQSGKDRLVLVSTDVIGFYSGTAKLFHEAITEAHDLKPSEVFLSAIHTHAGPSITLNEEKGHKNNVTYTKMLKKRIIQTVGEALKQVKPAAIGTGTGSSPVGVNRREVFYDEAGNPRTWIGRNPDGIMDRSVQVLKIMQQEKLKGVLFDYACHSTSLGWENFQISGDLHGLAEQFVERYLGAGVIAPGFAGASGEIDPWYRVLPGFKNKNGWVPEPVLMGTMLGEEVVHVLEAINNTEDNGPVCSEFVTLELPGKPDEQWETHSDTSPAKINVSVARVGSIAFVGLGGEVMSEIGMQIKKASPFEQTFIITHCNGTSGYLPPKHRYVEGGYEVKSSPFASSAADILVKRVVKMLHKLAEE